MHGFTKQAGIGDPSPTNVRAIANGGLKLVEVTFTGSESWRLQSGAYLASGFTAGLANGVGYASPVKFQYGYGGQGIFVDGTGAACLGSGAVTALGYTDVSQWKADLRAAYNAGTPYKMWYQPADESDATGLYAPIILQGVEYRATCLPLTAPLCEGDSVVSWARSGCDKVLVLDGSQNIQWVENSATPYGGLFVLSIPDAVMWASTKIAPVYSDKLNRVSTDAGEFNQGAISLRGTSRGLTFTLFGAKTTEAGKQYLAANPITVWYRSTAYTEAADIPVSLETHRRASLVLDGTEGWMAYPERAWCHSKSGITPGKGTDGTVVCSQFKGRANTSYIDTNWVTVSATGYVVIKSDAYTSDTEALSAYLAAQYAAGTPVTIVYQLATTITYAHPDVELRAYEDSNNSYTISTQENATISVTTKPM